MVHIPHLHEYVGIVDRHSLTSCKDEVLEFHVFRCVSDSRRAFMIFNLREQFSFIASWFPDDTMCGRNASSSFTQTGHDCNALAVQDASLTFENKVLVRAQVSSSLVLSKCSQRDQQTCHEEICYPDSL